LQHLAIDQCPDRTRGDFGFRLFDLRQRLVERGLRGALKKRYFWPSWPMAMDPSPLGVEGVRDTLRQSAFTD
jgi:hypothetical protein